MWTSGRIGLAPYFFGFTALAAILGSACVPDWDVYDPRLGGEASSSSAAGGGGGGGGGGGAGGMGGAGGGAVVCQAGSKVACYTGPSGTQGVGDCKDGLTTCNAEGTGFGPCEGEVVPASETCALPGDEDCDGLLNEDGATCTCTPDTQQACYSGPQGTQGIGACASGMQTCEPGGMGFGPCEGEVVPVIEGCATAGDDDCNGQANEHCAIWSKSYGSAGDQFAWDVAVDGSDNIVLGGRFINTIEFGGSTLVSQGGNDGFIAKLSPSGAHAWSRRFGDVAEQEVLSVAADTTGNVYATGFFAGSIQLGAQPQSSHSSKGGNDIFVVKYDSNGTHVWSKTFGDSASQVGLGIAVDASGSVVVTGRMTGTVNFGGGALTGTGASNGFLVKLDPQGNHLWSKIIGAGGENAGQGLAVDTTGNVYVAGYFTESITFGDPVQTGAGGHDVFIAKLTTLGVSIWTRVFGDAADQEAVSVDVDTTGDVVMLGEHGGTITFDGASHASKGVDDVFVAYLEPLMGGAVWSKSFGDAADQEPGGIALDAAGDVVLTGSYQGTLSFGGLPMTAPGSVDDIFLVKLSGAGGDHVWSRSFGGASDQDGRAVAVDSSDNVLFTGEYTGKINFGPGLITSSDAEDVCLVKLPP
jgi:hypothetical protein